jgi:class 3 adenylate cyclase/tetratricopeptide (TPR) repeat protein
VTEERKVVTVFFADLARSTELAASLDPERFREVMSAFFRMVSVELTSLRGRAEKFVGDAVMAVFGLPIAHDDDALRAVRAGLVIRDRTTRLGEELGLTMPLQVRVGINSGAVATGSGPADQLFVSGTPVNLAARLQQAAEPGEILVGETTHLLTRYTVEYGPSRVVEARGFEEPVVASPVVSLSTRSSRRTIPLVDRRRELAILSESFERVRETGRAHLVTLLGETGIGKSRLADELVAGLPEEAKVLLGRASVFEEDATFAPLASMIRRELGVDADAPKEEVADRLKEIVEGCCDPSESEQTAGRLGLALGLGAPAGNEGRSYRAAEIRAGMVTFLRGLTRDRPVVLVFEDLQFARDGLLDLIEQVAAAASRMPALFLCVARDELLEERPGWGAGLSDSFRVRLEPLSLEESKELARVAGEGLDEATAERIADRAGGNPFFIVETTGMLLQQHPDHVEGTPHDHLLPPTVQAVVASRIDHLPEDARSLFRKASVFPRSTFRVSELALIADPDPSILQSLEEAELLVRDSERPDVWRFRHAMLQDVAYESLPKRERLRLHLAVADGLEKAGGEERQPHSIAYHLEQAARAALDLDTKDRTIAERAILALSRVGDSSRRAMESATAVDFYERALQLAGPEEEWGKQEARILAGLGEARYWLGQFAEAESALERALEVGAGDDWTETFASRFLADIALNIRAEPERAEQLFQQAVEAARRLDDPYAMARTLLMAGWAPFWRDDLEAARALFEEALSIGRENPEGDPWAEARALTSLSSVISPVGDEEECLDLAEKALAIGRQMRDRFTVAVGQMYAGNSQRRMFRLADALPRLNEAVGIFRELESRWEHASALGDRATIHRLAGRTAEALSDIKLSLKLGRELGDRSVLSWTVAEQVRTLVAGGDLDGARRALEEAPQGSDHMDSVEVARALLELATGDHERALSRALLVLENERATGLRNPLAARTWWVARLFGDEHVGGEAVAEEARQTLERAHWEQFIREPELALPERTPA